MEYGSRYPFWPKARPWEFPWKRNLRHVRVSGGGDRVSGLGSMLYGTTLRGHVPSDLAFRSHLGSSLELSCLPELGAVFFSMSGDSRQEELLKMSSSSSPAASRMISFDITEMAYKILHRYGPAKKYSVKKIPPLTILEVVFVDAQGGGDTLVHEEVREILKQHAPACGCKSSRNKDGLVCGTPWSTRCVVCVGAEPTGSAPMASRCASSASESWKMCDLLTSRAQPRVQSPLHVPLMPR